MGEAPECPQYRLTFAHVPAGVSTIPELSITSDELDVHGSSAVTSGAVWVRKKPPALSEAYRYLRFNATVSHSYQGRPSAVQPR